jgi:hypothetical protein
MNLEVGKYYKKKDDLHTVYIKPISKQDVYGSVEAETLSIPDNPEMFAVIKDPYGSIINLNYKECSKTIVESSLEEYNSARELARSLI